MRFFQLCVSVTLVVCVSAEDAPPPRNMSIPCIGLLKNPPINCTGEELETGKAGFQKACDLKIAEEDGCEFMKTWESVDYNCTASMINEFYASGHAAQNFAGLYDMIKTQCAASAPNFADKVKSFYDKQVEKVHLIAEENQTCSEQIKTWEAEVYGLFQANGEPKLTPITVLSKACKFYTKFYETATAKNMTTCMPLWEGQFPRTVAAFRQFGEISYKLVSRLTDDKLEHTMQVMFDKMMNAKDMKDIQP